MWVTYKMAATMTFANGDGNFDILSVTPADDKPIRLVGWSIGNTTETGDAAEEGLEITVRHMTATVTITGGSSFTDVVGPHPGTSPAAGFTAKYYHATVATTSGTSRIAEEHGWNIRNTPWKEWYPEELRTEASQGEYLLLRCETTVADSITAPCTFYIEEWQ